MRSSGIEKMHTEMERGKLDVRSVGPLRLWDHALKCMRIYSDTGDSLVWIDWGFRHCAEPVAVTEETPGKTV